MRNLETLLTSEMTQEEWTEFRRQWINDYANSLVVETELGPEDAMQVAEIRFEDYVGQEGYTGRNEDILQARMAGLI